MKNVIVALVVGLVIGVTATVLVLNKDNLGAAAGPDHYFPQNFIEGYISGTVAVSSTTATIRETDLGKTVFMEAASGTTVTLPATKKGGWLRFVINTAFDTANVVVDSAEGDNISGTVEVNSLTVPCVAEDQINFVNTAESLGDYVELVSDGSSWFITGGTASSTGGLTCTDPS